jgi:CheY-like chemotaxis protein
MTVTQPWKPDLKGASILVVEDEFYLAMETKQEIERVGGTVLGPFSTGSEGIARLGEGKPDLALIDINLGEGPCFAVADALDLEGVPFVFLTGYDPATIPARFAHVERVQKPTDHRIVIEALGRLRGDCASSNGAASR